MNLESYDEVEYFFSISDIITTLYWKNSVYRRVEYVGIIHKKGIPMLNLILKIMAK